MKMLLILTTILINAAIAGHAQSDKNIDDKNSEVSSSQLKKVPIEQGAEIAPMPSYKTNDHVEENPHFIYERVQTLPQSKVNINEYLVKNLLYPELARDNKVQGKLTARFVVEKDGSLTNIKIIKGAELQNGLPEEVIRVIKLMPKWNPGMQNGVPVRVYHTLPFTFRLQ